MIISNPNLPSYTLDTFEKLFPKFIYKTFYVVH